MTLLQLRYQGTGTQERQWGDDGLRSGVECRVEQGHQSVVVLEAANNDGL